MAYLQFKIAKGSLSMVHLAKVMLYKLHAVKVNVLKATN